MILLASFIPAPGAAQDAAAQASDILHSILLPRTSQILRESGVPDEEVQSVIEAASVREHGPVDNFGAFVQDQLAAGLRGRDLAAAIHAEHARRGIGKGKKLESKKARGKAQAERGRLMRDEPEPTDEPARGQGSERRPAEVGDRAGTRPDSAVRDRRPAGRDTLRGRRDTLPGRGGGGR
jgi:hypothetical protein